MLPILFEDNYLLVINKPPGLQVERDHWGNPSVEDRVGEYFQENFPWKKQLIVGIVHRLDRPVSGVLILAKTRMALKQLNRQFEERKVKKTYLAWVENKPPKRKGELVHWLKKSDKLRKAIVTTEKNKHAKQARLRYRVRHSANDRTLLDVLLLTGRYHQIRAQLGAIGSPIVGDEKYGSKIKSEGGEIALQSNSLTISHPKTQETMCFEAPPPECPIWRL